LDRRFAFADYHNLDGGDAEEDRGDGDGDFAGLPFETGRARLGTIDGHSHAKSARDRVSRGIRAQGILDTNE